MTEKKVASNVARRRKSVRSTPKPKSFKRVAGTLVEPSMICLTKIPGTPGKGAGYGGEKWRVDAMGLRAGVVFINVIDQPPIGKHASIQIFLNLKNQGRGIGRVAYRMACENSQHSIIYANMRKSNTASWRAAELAGFVDATPQGFKQKIMKYVRLT